MTVDFRPLLDLKFWFDLSPQPPSNTMSMAIFIAFAVLAVASVVVRALRRRTEDKLRRVLLARVASMLMTMGLVGLLFFFFHFERASFLGARFWFLAWTIGLVVWIVSVVRFARRDMPRMRGENAAVKARAKYLPK